MSTRPDDWDLEVCAQLSVDPYYYFTDSLRREAEFDIKRRLRQQIERMLPEGYTLDDAVYAQYESYRDERSFQVHHRLRVYL